MSHHDRLRDLLDQRSSRALVRPSYSDCEDTPSLYSPTAFSPVYDLPPTMHDLHDPRPSYPAEPYEDDSDLEPSTRMSYLGPKMRFHSRAPWELEDDPLDEAPEPDENPRHFTSGFPFSRATGQRPSTPCSSSPRPSYSSRPSVDSSHSQLPPKRSFETINSQTTHPRGALYALAQESLSTNSLARSTARPKESLTSKFSLGRLRPEPEPPVEPLPPSPIHGRFPPSLRGHEQPNLSFDTIPPSNPHDPYSSRSHTISAKESMHPYANPDLVSTYSEDQESVDDEHSTLDYTPPLRHDSVTTVTETFSTASMMRTTSRSTQSPEGPSASKARAASIQAKNISSPVSVVVPAQRVDNSVQLPPGVNNLPGWTERNAPPTFSLISLEEARAQRSRTSTVNGPSRMSTSSGISNSSTPFPGSSQSGHGQTTEPSTFVNIASRARGRSISAGAKAKNAIQTIVSPPKPERRESEPAVPLAQAASGPPGKSLKHKKSGFMRLFNGGKSQDKDNQEAPPPVPALPDIASSSQPLPRTPRSPTHRIPVPSLSPSLSELASAQSSDSLPEPHPWRAPGGQRRLPPTLSINTIHEGPSRSSTSAVGDRPSNNLLQRPWHDEQPQSAPPVITEFPALKLRPVSTLFSAFSDHLVTPDSRLSAETSDGTEVVTPRSPSPNELISPITPNSYTRISQDQLPIKSVQSGDQAAVKALQEQLVSAKAAWQKQIWELEGQVRDLKAELAEVKGGNSDEYCDACGRGKKPSPPPSIGGVVNRPRARTATSTRFGHPLP